MFVNTAFLYLNTSLDDLMDGREIDIMEFTTNSIFIANVMFTVIEAGVGVSVLLFLKTGKIHPHMNLADETVICSLSVGL